MLKSFRVQNFRGLSDLAIEPLDRVNLITGMNNTGKTALLEAIYLHCNPGNPRSVIEINEYRGISLPSSAPGYLEETYGWLLPVRQTAMTMVLTSVDQQDRERTVELAIIDPTTQGNQYLSYLNSIGESIPSPQLGYFLSSLFAVTLRYKDSGLSPLYHSVGFLDPTQSSLMTVAAQIPWKPSVKFLSFGRTILDEEIELFSELDASNRLSEIRETMRLLEPNLQRLSLLIFNGEPMIHGDIGLKRLMPITFMGEGFRRLLAIVLAIVNTQAGILLIDEIDAGLHHSILPKIFEAIGQAARVFDVQVFATTHSYECIMAAHRAFDEHEPYDLRLHRLERIDGRVQAVTYDRETLETSEELMLEVR
jgi:predicted ATPase